MNFGEWVYIDMANESWINRWRWWLFSPLFITHWEYGWDAALEYGTQKAPTNNASPTLDEAMKALGYLEPTGKGLKTQVAAARDMYYHLSPHLPQANP